MGFLGAAKKARDLFGGSTSSPSTSIREKGDKPNHLRLVEQPETSDLTILALSTSISFDAAAVSGADLDGVETLVDSIRSVSTEMVCRISENLLPILKALRTSRENVDVLMETVMTMEQRCRDRMGGMKSQGSIEAMEALLTTYPVLMASLLQSRFVLLGQDLVIMEYIARLEEYRADQDGTLKSIEAMRRDAITVNTTVDEVESLALDVRKIADFAEFGVADMVGDAVPEIAAAFGKLQGELIPRSFAIAKALVEAKKPDVISLDQELDTAAGIQASINEIATSVDDLVIDIDMPGELLERVGDDGQVTVGILQRLEARVAALAETMPSYMQVAGPADQEITVVEVPQKRLPAPVKAPVPDSARFKEIQSIQENMGETPEAMIEVIKVIDADAEGECELTDIEIRKSRDTFPKSTVFYEAISRHPATPVDVLDEMLKDQSSRGTSIIGNCLAHQNGELEWFDDIRDEHFSYVVQEDMQKIVGRLIELSGQGPESANIVLDQITQCKIDLWPARIQNTVGFLQQYFDQAQPDWLESSMMTRIAEHIGNMIEELNHYLVSRGYTERAALREKVFDQVRPEMNELVETMLSHPSNGKESLDIACELDTGVEGCEWEFILIALRNHSAASDFLWQYIDCEEVEIQTALLENPNLSTQGLNNLARKVSSELQMLALEHPKASDFLFSHLSENGASDEVKAAAADAKMAPLLESLTGTYTST